MMTMTIDCPTPAQLPALQALWQEAFGDSEEFIDLFFQNGFRFDRCRVLTEGTVLGAVYWFDCSCRGFRYAYVYALGVKRAARGRGVGTRLMEDLHRHLADCGYDGCLLCPANEGLFDYYGPMGYTTCAHMAQFTCEGGAPILLERLAPQEYARRRQAFLPPDAAEFDEAALGYLAAYTGLYGGDGFVLAAYRDGECLVGSELLGDASRAPGIVAALGCTRGVFKTPGEAVPHVMYRPLSKGAPVPGYLGLVLD